ncbi:hypothetical protein E6C76_08625 [Pseudothauera nasutitermitis]|uniref:Uncharacterized protein n=1 Tax=Pseudothauera nasutitermitis TaxID=2565930 RepID=A0A4S4AZX7_9RHOO|nr:hypothetical protein E6C76_08625 [Pseudothauera nasutitermitis]
MPPCKRHETELTYCPIYGFKPHLICTKGLTQAIFGGSNRAERMEDLRIPPSNRLEKLVGDRTGQWSIRINDPWPLPVLAAQAHRPAAHSRRYMRTVERVSSLW